MFEKIVLLLILGLLIVLIFLLTKKRSSGVVEDKVLNKAFADQRVNQQTDLQISMRSLSEEMNQLNYKIQESMREAKESNQKEIYTFLEQTKDKLQELQVHFGKESTSTKESNQKHIQELITQTKESLYDLKTRIIKEMNDLQVQNQEQTLKTQDRINKEILGLKEQIEKDLVKGFEKNEQALHAFIEKITVIEHSTKQLESLKEEIIRFREVLNDHKARGNFGEALLENILINTFGQNKELFESQVDLNQRYELKLKEKRIIDFLFYSVNKEGVLPIAIDAKFPFDHYLKLTKEGISEFEYKSAYDAFRRDVKKQIKDISDKYIISNVTAPYALMFIPAEAVFLEIYKTFPDLVEEARKAQVIIVSPSLIIAILYILQGILKDYQTSKHATQILEAIHKISTEFRRFSDRFDKLKKKVEEVFSSTNELEITKNKIITQFDQAESLLDITDDNE